MEDINDLETIIENSEERVPSEVITTLMEMLMDVNAFEQKKQLFTKGYLKTGIPKVTIKKYMYPNSKSYPITGSKKLAEILLDSYKRVLNGESIFHKKFVDMKKLNSLMRGLIGYEMFSSPEEEARYFADKFKLHTWRTILSSIIMPKHVKYGSSSYLVYQKHASELRKMRDNEERWDINKKYLSDFVSYETYVSQANMVVEKCGFLSKEHLAIHLARIFGEKETRMINTMYNNNLNRKKIWNDYMGELLERKEKDEELDVDKKLLLTSYRIPTRVINNLALKLGTEEDFQRISKELSNVSGIRADTIYYNHLLMGAGTAPRSEFDYLMKKVVDNNS
ncbi:hypothetical protein HQ529_05055 [Candidatus Woesearchaeota archaeon]|nr:hypothetical protein [Candidatus Woesearchaeota archaeon]